MNHTVLDSLLEAVAEDNAKNLQRLLNLISYYNEYFDVKSESHIESGVLLINADLDLLKMGDYSLRDWAERHCIGSFNSNKWNRFTGFK
jgi:hypothetical protein